MHTFLCVCVFVCARAFVQCYAIVFQKLFLIQKWIFFFIFIYKILFTILPELKFDFEEKNFYSEVVHIFSQIPTH